MERFIEFAQLVEGHAVESMKEDIIYGIIPGSLAHSTSETYYSTAEAIESRSRFLEFNRLYLITHT